MEKKRIPRLTPWHLLAVFAAALLLFEATRRLSSGTELAYSDFKQALARGEIEEVFISPTLVSGRLKAAASPATQPARSQTFRAVRVEDPQLVPELEKQQVKIVGIPPESGMGTALLWLLPLGLFLAFSLFSRLSSGAGPQGGLMNVGRSRAKLYAEKNIPVRFTDVAGVDEAKDELREVIDFLREPDKFQRLGGRLPKGILLVGPPGTGKTLLARAVAGEASVPFFSISGSEFVEMFVGVGAARVRDLFEQAKQKAPCIIFIDELDALGKVRGLSLNSNDEREQTLNQLLVELDGFDTRTGVILMAATNRPEILDPALLRAGRFDRHVLVDRPDKAGRLEILKVHSRDVRMGSDVDLERVAAMTVGMVGADMENIVNEAALLAARRDSDEVCRADFDEAVERVIAGLAKKNRVLSPAERNRVAYHEVGHALVAMAIPGSDEVKKISLVPRGIAALGYTLQTPTSDRFLLTESELEGRIAVLLAGRSAEELVFKEVSTGAQDDLVKATDIARSMVMAYGMSERLGPVSLERISRSPLLGPEPTSPQPQCSEAASREIDQEVRRIIETARGRASELLGSRLPSLHAVAKALLAQESLTGEELASLVAKTPPVAPTTLGGERERRVG